MFNLPNNLTLLRIAAAPGLIILMYFPGRVTCLAAMCLYIAASLTDIFDGLIARRFNLVTNMGKFLDPLADKVLAVTALVMLTSLNWAEPWVVAAIICREITVTGLRAMAADQGVVIAADAFGKLKTIVQTVAICPLLLHYPWFGLDPAPIGRWLLYFALALTLVSGVNYLYRFYTGHPDSSGGKRYERQ
jgi:CDP-diacylglycerol---glycerol-3-phosphate 3-phosphatidyltransferase